MVQRILAVILVVGLGCGVYWFANHEQIVRDFVEIVDAETQAILSEAETYRRESEAVRGSLGQGDAAVVDYLVQRQTYVLFALILEHVPFVALFVFLIAVVVRFITADVAQLTARAENALRSRAKAEAELAVLKDLVNGLEAKAQRQQGYSRLRASP